MTFIDFFLLLGETLPDREYLSGGDPTIGVAGGELPADPDFWCVFFATVFFLFRFCKSGEDLDFLPEIDTAKNGDGTILVGPLWPGASLADSGTIGVCATGADSTLGRRPIYKNK